MNEFPSYGRAIDDDTALSDPPHADGWGLPRNSRRQLTAESASYHQPSASASVLYDRIYPESSAPGRLHADPALHDRQYPEAHMPSEQISFDALNLPRPFEAQYSEIERLAEAIRRDGNRSRSRSRSPAIFVHKPHDALHSPAYFRNLDVPSFSPVYSAEGVGRRSWRPAPSFRPQSRTWSRNSDYGDHCHSEDEHKGPQRCVSFSSRDVFAEPIDHEERFYPPSPVSEKDCWGPPGRVHSGQPIGAYRPSSPRSPRSEVSSSSESWESGVSDKGWVDFSLDHSRDPRTIGRRLVKKRSRNRADELDFIRTERKPGSTEAATRHRRSSLWRSSSLTSL